MIKKHEKKEIPKLGDIRVTKHFAFIPKSFTICNGDKYTIWCEHYYTIERYLERWVNGNGCRYRKPYWQVDFYALEDNLDEVLKYIEEDTKGILNSYNLPPKPLKKFKRKED